MEMILTDFLSGGRVKNTSVQNAGTQSERADAGLVSRQIKALTPGQTLQGEVVSRNGSQVQIKVGEDMILEARVDQSVNLELGKNVTFEVRNNGQTLTLSPLFANTASQNNALKALEMASLPVNQDTLSMTGLMMKAGLSIDRYSLQQMFREVNAFPESDISDVVDLHKLGLPVNEENLTQISAYKNLDYQLGEGMRAVLDALPETMEAMMKEGNIEGAARMFQELLQMIRESGEPEGAEAARTEGSLEAADGQPGNAMVGETAVGQRAEDGSGMQGRLSYMPDIAIQDAQEGAWQEAVGRSAEGTDGRAQLQETDADAARQMNADMQGEILKLFGEDAEKLWPAPETGNSAEYQSSLQQVSQAFLEGDLAGQAKALQQLIGQGLQDGNYPLLEGLLTNKGMHHLLSEGLSGQWTLKPEEVAASDKVEALYARLDRQLKSLAQHLEQNGQTQSPAYKAVGNMTQNLDFLQQLNQAYTYVQLPLRLQQGDAHGDLYVYTNKRNLAAKDGEITALLHLDMEHLGPVDVYVAMQAGHVNTRFYVQDDEILDFIEEHMQLLTNRLQKRGYDCAFAMQVKDGKEPGQGGIRGLMRTQAHTPQPIAQYAFDVRA